MKNIIRSKKAEGNVGTAIKIVIIVVISGLILTGVFSLVNGQIKDGIDKTYSIQQDNSDNNVISVPSTATYTTGMGVVYNEMPDVPSDNDRYIYEDFIYTYSKADNGWAVEIPSANKNKTTYSSILEEICGKPIIRLDGTFKDCINMTTAPRIPDCVKYLSETFKNCASLNSAPEIPETAVIMRETFYGCTSLADISNITIPDNVSDINSLFYCCSELNGRIIVNAEPTNYANCFYGCNKENIELFGDSSKLSEISYTFNSF